MKKYGFLALTCMFVSLCVMAQDAPTRRGPREGRKMDKATMVQRMTNRQAKRLSLTEVQIDSMKIFNTDFLTQMESLRPNRMPKMYEHRVIKDSLSHKKGDKKVARKLRREQKLHRNAQIDSLRTNYNLRVKSILTTEQYAEFEKMQNERPQHGNRPRGPQREHRGWQQGGGEFDNPEMED